MKKYKLNGRIPEEVEDLLEWGESFQLANRRVAVDDVGKLHISTIFLGMDHNFHEGGPPLLFETMVFQEDGSSGECERYSTWEEAEAGHQEWVERLKRM